jgi:hypothetical protein
MVGKAMTVVLSSVVLLGLGATEASAKPAPANPPAPTGTVTTAASGAVTVSATGTWSWPVGTQPGQLPATAGTAKDECGGRYGVGWGVAWNDASDPGYTISYKKKGVSYPLNVGSLTDPNGQAVSYDSSAPCGQFTSSMVSGTWTISHTYAAGTTVPSEICVVSYVLKSARPGHKKMYQVNTNRNNSFKAAVKHGHGSLAAFEVAPNCFDPASFKASPTIVTTATNAQVGAPVTDSAVLSNTAAASVTSNAFIGNAAGNITFVLYGPTDTNCTSTPVFTSSPVAVNGNGTYGPVSFTPTQGPGTYRWIATYSGAPNNNGATEVCGATGETSTVTAGPATAVANPPTSPTSSVPVVTTAANGGSTTSAAVTGATTVHTGEPWAGSRPFEIALIALGLSLMGLGFFERRRSAVRKLAARRTVPTN